MSQKHPVIVVTGSSGAGELEAHVLQREVPRVVGLRDVVQLDGRAPARTGRIAQDAARPLPSREREAAARKACAQPRRERPEGRHPPERLGLVRSARLRAFSER